MNEVPRTFCITLRETPKRKEEAIKYFEQVGLKVEMFDGIHGQSFGLKTTIPNYTVLPGREYFITPGAVGNILSHLMLWKVLLTQPEDEFLIVEDDVVLGDGFAEKFTKIKSELPADWEMAYVGWNAPTGEHASESPTHVSENVVITKPSDLHAYLVKKSALKVLIATNQLAWNTLDAQVVERSLPKLVHYAFNPPLISQKSVIDVKDEVWYSLCYDWALKPEWLNSNTKNAIRLGSGWHPLEKNSEGYMIWSDGRGEFVFDDEWVSMEITFIAEGEIEKKLRVICPSQADQVFDLRYTIQTISFPINGAKSVILVSDTFRPIDIYKTSDCRRLGIRLLKGINLTDKNGKVTVANLYSMYGAKKNDETNKMDGVKVFKAKYSHADGKINLDGQFSHNAHRSGWGHVLNLLSQYHKEESTVFDGWLERAFSSRKDEYSQLRLIPYRESWVGVFHHPPNMPSWITTNGTLHTMLSSNQFQDSLGMCKGIYTLSEHTSEYVRCYLKKVPVETLYLPTEVPDVMFSFDEFTENTNKKLVNIGYWLRKASSIYLLEADPLTYQKVRLLPQLSWGVSEVDRILEIEAKFRKKELTEEMKKSVVDIRHMPNEEYDELLSKNIVFLDFYDTSASNAIVECMARGTPVLVNPLPSVIEYLGEGYPFYFTTLNDAAKKLKNPSLIKATHEYLMTSGVREKITGDYFLKTIRDGQIWKSLV